MQEVFVVLQSGAWAGEDATQVLAVKTTPEAAEEVVKEQLAEYGKEDTDDLWYVDDFNDRGGVLLISKSVLS